MYIVHRVHTVALESTYFRVELDQNYLPWISLTYMIEGKVNIFLFEQVFLARGFFDGLTP